MQYIQIQPQLAASVPTPEVGNLNIFVDSVTNVLSFKDYQGRIYQSEALNGGVYNPINGVLSLTSNSGSIDLTGFTNGNIISGSYLDGNLTLTNSIGDEIVINGFSTSSGGNVIDVTYDELYSAITGSTLETGSTYRLTDYKSVNFLNGYQKAVENPTPVDVNFNPREVYISDEEVLILKAISNNSLEPNVYSEKYKNDKIEFLPYVNKIGLPFSFSNGSTLPNDEEVSNFDLQWDGTNVYIQMPNNYPILFGHYFYLYAEFEKIFEYQSGGQITEISDPAVSLPFYINEQLGGFLGTSDIIKLNQESSGFQDVQVNVTTNGSGEGFVGIITTYFSNGFYYLDLRPLSQGFFQFLGNGYQEGDEIYFNYDGQNYTYVLTSNVISEQSASYPNLHVLSEQGVNATLNININLVIENPTNPSQIFVLLEESGELYVNGDTIRVLGSDIGLSTPSNDVQFTIGASPIVTQSDSKYYYQDGSFEPITPYINECQHPHTNDDVDSGYGKKMSRIQVVDNGYKVILLDLTEEDFNNYIEDTLYVQYVYSIGDAYGWITRRNDTERNINVPFDFRNRKYRRFEASLSFLDISFGTNYWLIGDTKYINGNLITTNGNFKDFKVLQNDSNEAFSINWDGIGGPDSYLYNGYEDNNVIFKRIEFVTFKDYTYDNTISGIELTNFMCRTSNNIINRCYYSNFGADFSNNRINLVQNCSFGNNHSDNIYSGSLNNKFGNDFYNNNFTNSYNNDFGNDHISNNYFNLNNNKFSNTYRNNQIYNANNNVFGDNTFGLITNQDLTFRNNNFLIGVNNINFTNSTHVYNSANNIIQNDFNGNKVLTYIKDGVLTTDIITN